MKLFLNKILVVIVGVCFLSAYFEFNDAEKKQNYEKETHTYISAEKQAHIFSIKKIEKNPIVFLNFETVISKRLKKHKCETICQARLPLPITNTFILIFFLRAMIRIRNF